MVLISVLYCCPEVLDQLFKPFIALPLEAGCLKRMRLPASSYTFLGHYPEEIAKARLANPARTRSAESSRLAQCRAGPGP